VRSHDDEIGTAGLGSRDERFSSRTVYEDGIGYDTGTGSLLACSGTDNSVIGPSHKKAFHYIGKLDVRAGAAG